MPKKWLTFDLDGTLMQNPFVGWVFPEIVSIVQKRLGETTDIMKLILAEHHNRIRTNNIVGAYNWDNILEQVFQENNIPLTIDVKKIVIKHSTAPKVYLLEDDVLNGLEQIGRKGYSLAVATNGYFKYQFPVMRELHLTEVFEEIITPEQSGFVKPDSRMLEPLVNQGQIIGHVGDRLDHDIMMANKMGIKSILLHRAIPPPLTDIPVGERNKSQLLIDWCKEKWTQETNYEEIPFTEDCIPDIVVFSVNELSSYLCGINK